MSIRKFMEPPVSASFNNDESITWILQAAVQGKPGAEAELFDVTYQKLRELADHMMLRQAAGHTLQSTALVNEATLRFLGNATLDKLEGSEHFYAAMARAMRCVLVDHARKRKSQRHGGEFKRVQLDIVLDQLEGFGRVDILALDEALNRLAEFSKRHFELVQLRFFLGMTVGEVASHQEVSISTIERDWRFARAWLASELSA